MKKTYGEHRAWRALWLLPVAAIGIFSIVATGGGGGGGNDNFDNDDETVRLLPTYNFFLTNLPGNNPFTVVIGNGLTAVLDIDGLFPSQVDLVADANLNVTFLAYRTLAGAAFDLSVTTVGGSPVDGTLAVLITEDIAGNVGEPPTSGAFRVSVGADRIVATASAAGVSLSLNGGAAVDYTWDEFSALIDDANEEAWLRRASLAGNAIEFMYEMFFTVADVLDELEALTLVSPVTDTCDMFTGAPPEGLLAQGDVTLTWLGSGELLPGDDFNWQFNECWFDDPASPIDEWVNGTISMEEYTETVDYNTNILFEIGFGGLSGQPGGIVFDLTIAQTVEDNAVFSIPAETVLNVSGGFAMIIQSP